MAELTQEQEEEIYDTQYFDCFQQWTEQTAKYPKMYIIVDSEGDMMIEQDDSEDGRSDEDDGLAEPIDMRLVGSNFRMVDAAWLYPVLELVGESGEVADKFKKILRDDGGIIQADKRVSILTELGDVQYAIARVADSLNEDLSNVVKRVRTKLLDRLKRGVVGGSGDAR